MKSILATALLVLSLSAAFAVEYETWLLKAPQRERSLTVLPTDLVEIVGLGGIGTIVLGVTMADGSQFSDSFTFEYRSPAKKTGILQGPITGIRQLTLTAVSDQFLVTIKVTPASQINLVGPTTILSVPDRRVGNYDVVIESSRDLVSWAPFFTQTVTTDTNTHFFRTRVVRTETPVQKP